MTFPDRILYPDDIAATYPVEVELIDHGLEESQRIHATMFISDPEANATGMEQLNDRIFQVHVTSEDTFQLYDIQGYAIDGSGYTPFTGNGLARFTLTGPDLFVENTA